MNTLEAIKTRRSIRDFKEEKVSRETIEQIISAASYAPSWKNSQVTRYVAIEDESLIKKIGNDCVCGFDYNSNTLVKTPLLFVVSCIKGRSGFERDGSYSTPKEDRWQTYDTGIATATLCLAAHELGVGTVIMGIFDEKAIATLIQLPEDQEITAIVASGYAKTDPLLLEAPKRKSVDQLLRFL